MVRDVRAPEPQVSHPAQQSIRADHVKDAVLTLSFGPTQESGSFSRVFGLSETGTGIAPLLRQGMTAGGRAMRMSRWIGVLTFVALGCVACGGEAPQTPAGPSSTGGCTARPVLRNAGRDDHGQRVGRGAAGGGGRAGGRHADLLSGRPGRRVLAGWRAGGRRAIAIRGFGRRRLGCPESRPVRRRRQRPGRRGRGDGHGPERVAGMRAARSNSRAVSNRWTQAELYPRGRRADGHDERPDGHPRRQRRREGVRGPRHRPARARQGNTGRGFHRRGQHPHPEHQRRHSGERQRHRRPTERNFGVVRFPHRRPQDQRRQDDRVLRGYRAPRLQRVEGRCAG